MTTEQGPVAWSAALAVVVVLAILRTLIAMERWDGVPFIFGLRAQGRSANIVGATVTWAVSFGCAFGLWLSLSR